MQKALSNPPLNQLRTPLLTRAGEAVALSLRPSVLRFVMKTTWRFFLICWVKHWQSYSMVLSMSHCLWAPSLHWVI